MLEKKLIVEPVMDSMALIQAMIEELLEEALIPMKISIKMNIVVDEIFSNIIYYSGAKEAVVTCKAGEGRVELDFSDDGKPYNPLEAKEPDITLGAEEREAGGLGILITKKMMDTINYEYTDGRNQLHMMKEV